MIGGLITCSVMPALDKFGVDDPVGAAATHGIFYLVIKIIFKNLIH